MLELGNTDMQEKGLIGLSVALWDNRSLEVLNLESPLIHNRCQGDVAMQMGRMLGNNTCLREVSAASATPCPTQPFPPIESISFPPLPATGHTHDTFLWCMYTPLVYNKNVVHISRIHSCFNAVTRTGF